LADAAQNPIDQLKQAAADLWTSVARSGEDHIVFFDHAGCPTRVRLEDGGFRIGWADTADEGGSWVESTRRFEDPREAAFYAFQGREGGGDRG